jgi:dUTP pyrophosphatase
MINTILCIGIAALFVVIMVTYVAYVFSKDVNELNSRFDRFEQRQKAKPQTIEMKMQLDECAALPLKAHELDAGFDLYTPNRDIVIHACDSVIIDTGVHVAIPAGCTGFIKSRSGMAMKENLIADTGVIDAGYTGSIRVRVQNAGRQPQTIQAHTRFCQLVVLKLAPVHVMLVNSLEDTERGVNGFGSTGKS